MMRLCPSEVAGEDETKDKKDQNEGEQDKNPLQDGLDLA
jgi:hypothetical protein